MHMGFDTLCLDCPLASRSNPLFGCSEVSSFNPSTIESAQSNRDLSCGSKLFHNTLGSCTFYFSAPLISVCATYEFNFLSVLLPTYLQGPKGYDFFFAGSRIIYFIFGLGFEANAMMKTLARGFGIFSAHSVMFFILHYDCPK